MRSRCEDPNCRSYKNYGGRGIVVLWQSFEEFYADMGPSYQPGLTLDRIDNDGPYCKGNCRWANWTEQANNKRGNTLILFKRRIQTISQWGREIGISPKVLWARHAKGWTVERMLTTPKMQQHLNQKKGTPQKGGLWIH